VCSCGVRSVSALTMMPTAELWSDFMPLSGPLHTKTHDREVYRDRLRLSIMNKSRRNPYQLATVVAIVTTIALPTLAASTLPTTETIHTSHIHNAENAANAGHSVIPTLEILEDYDPAIDSALQLLFSHGYMVCRNDTKNKRSKQEVRHRELDNVPVCSELSRKSSPTKDNVSLRRRKLRWLVETENSLSSAESESLATEDGPGVIIFNVCAALFCVTLAALAAGLTLGLLGLDPLVLLIKQRAAVDPKEKAMASQLLPIVKQHHRLLVTLLLMNSIANEALPIFLEKLVPSTVAILLSVTLVLFMGEIVPSAIFTGPEQLVIASRLAPLVKMAMFLLYPIAGPIAKLLDCLLHDEEELSAYNRGELSALIRIQYEERLAMKRNRKRERAKTAAATDATHKDLDNDLSLGQQVKQRIGQAITHGSVLGGLDFVGAPTEQRRTSVATLQEDMQAVRAVKNHLEHVELHHQMLQSGSIRPSHLSSFLTGDSHRSSVASSIRSDTDSIHRDEVMIMEGALQMKTKVAMDLMHPKRLTYRLPDNMVLNESNLVKIYATGFSRIPVYRSDIDDNAVCGVLITKQLIVVDSNDNRPLSTLPLYCPTVVGPTMSLVDLLNILQRGGGGMKGGHLALVCANPKVGAQALNAGEPLPKTAGWMGVISLEDVLEALLQEEIYDEFDKMHMHVKSLANNIWKLWKRYKLRQKIKEKKEREKSIPSETTTLLPT